jgi:hypothetical protein
VEGRARVEIRRVGGGKEEERRGEEREGEKST